MKKYEVDVSEAKALGWVASDPSQKTIPVVEYELEDIPKLLNREIPCCSNEAQERRWRNYMVSFQ